MIARDFREARVPRHDPPLGFQGSVSQNTSFPGKLCILRLSDLLSWSHPNMKVHTPCLYLGCSSAALHRPRVGSLVPKLAFLFDPEAPEMESNRWPEPEPNAPDDEGSEE